MISTLHLLWIIPAAVMFGFFTAAIIVAQKWMEEIGNEKYSNKR